MTKEIPVYKDKIYNGFILMGMLISGISRGLFLRIWLSINSSMGDKSCPMQNISPYIYKISSGGIITCGKNISKKPSTAKIVYKTIMRVILLHNTTILNVILLVNFIV